MSKDIEAVINEAAGDEAATRDAAATAENTARQAEVQSAAEEWASLPKMFGSMLAIAMPELAGVYTDAACLSWGTAMVPVADKYGWSMTAFGPEIALAAATVPFAVATVITVKKHKAIAEQEAKRGKLPAPAAAAAPAPGAVVASSNAAPMAMPV